MKNRENDENITASLVPRRQVSCGDFALRQHIVPGEVFGGGSDWHATLEYLEANVCPLADRLEIDTPVDERLGKVPSPCAEGVCADCYRAGNLIGFEELNGL